MDITEFSDADLALAKLAVAVKHSRNRGVELQIEPETREALVYFRINIGVDRSQDVRVVNLSDTYGLNNMRRRIEDRPAGAA